MTLPSSIPSIMQMLTGGHTTVGLAFTYGAHQAMMKISKPYSNSFKILQEGREKFFQQGHDKKKTKEIEKIQKQQVKLVKQLNKHQEDEPAQLRQGPQLSDDGGENKPPIDPPDNNEGGDEQNNFPLNQTELLGVWAVLHKVPAGDFIYLFWKYPVQSLVMAGHHYPVSLIGKVAVNQACLALVESLETAHGKNDNEAAMLTGPATFSLVGKLKYLLLSVEDQRSIAKKTSLTVSYRNDRKYYDDDPQPQLIEPPQSENTPQNLYSELASSEAGSENSQDLSGFSLDGESNPGSDNLP